MKMKTKLTCSQLGSVLMTSLLTITILTMICATSLYVTSQNGNATTQTTSWQQALSGAEAAVDQAINALNNNSWSGWYTVTSGSLPQTQPSPSGTPNATSSPGTGNYNYYTSSFTLQGEASNSVTMWVTVDNGSVGPTPSPSPGLIQNGRQAYRIRATGVVAAPGPPRVSNQKLDNDLRKMSLRFDRLGGGAISTPQAARRIEVIATPVTPGLFSLGLEVGTNLQMSGSGTADSFKSSLVPGNHQWSLPYRRSNVSIGLVDNSSSDLRSTYVYGSLTYSSSATPPKVPKNTTNVGSVQSPFGGSIAPAPTPPTGVTYTTYTGGGSSPPNSGQFSVPTNGGTEYIKVNGDLVVSSSGNPLHIVQHDSSTPEQMIIWVTGQLKTQGSGYIQQDPNVKVTYYVGGDITISGTSYQNNAGYAADLVIYGMGGANSKVTVSGSSTFTGAIDAPGYDVTISGGGDFSGAIIADTVTISGGSSFHYDEDLNTASLAGGGSFAFSSWFEDNSDPARGITY